jgi:hypothetical protein
MAQRHLMRLGSFTVQLEPIKKGLVAITYNGVSVGEGRHLIGWKPRATKASLDVYISLSNLYAVMLASVGPEVVAVFYSKSTPQAWQSQFENYFGDKTLADSIEDQFPLLLNEFIVKTGWESGFTQMKTDFQQIIDALYTESAITSARDPQVNGCLARMEKDGLLPVLNNNIGLLKSLAGFTLCSSFLMTTSEGIQALDMILPNHEVPAVHAVTALEACAEQHGFHLLSSPEAKTLTSYV